jgi:hypothetical protein
LSVYREKIPLITGLLARGTKYVGFNDKFLDLEPGINPDIDIGVSYFNEAVNLYAEFGNRI